jgi:AcrR family transcriptional regulator
MSTTTPARGDQTREALLTAAIKIFGRDGFHAASTRAIATEAGANQALIGYHFGGKQGLYLAAFESIAAQVAKRMRPVIETIEQHLSSLESSSEATTLACIESMESLFGALLDLMLQESSAPWVRLIVRAQLEPDQGFEVLYQGVMGTMLQLLTRLVAMASNRQESVEAVRLQALMLLGQVLVFLIARGAVSQQMGWVQLGTKQRESVKAQLRVHLDALFLVESVR